MFREYKWYLAHGFKRKVALEIVNARQPYYKTVGKEWRQICNYQKSELKIIDCLLMPSCKSILRQP